MSERPEKSRRDTLRRQWEEEQRAKAVAAIPADHDEIEGLFDMLDRDFPVKGCDHTLRLTEQYIADQGLPHDAMVQWLNDNGGFCDCEVLANVEERFAAATGRGKKRDMTDSRRGPQTRPE